MTAITSRTMPSISSLLTSDTGTIGTLRLDLQGAHENDAPSRRIPDHHVEDFLARIVAPAPGAKCEPQGRIDLGIRRVADSPIVYHAVEERVNVAAEVPPKFQKSA